MMCTSFWIRHVGVCLFFVVLFAGCGSDDTEKPTGAGGKPSKGPAVTGGAADASGGGGDSSVGGFETPDAAFDAYGKALVDGDMAAFRKIAAKDSRAVSGMEAIIQMQKDKSPEEAARINLQALAPHQGFGDAVSKRFAAEIDGDNAIVVQLFEREIAFEKKIHYRKFKFSKSGGKWYLAGSDAGEASELTATYAWDGQAEAKTVVSSGPMPMSLIPQDAFAAVVVHPKRAASSEVGQALLKLDVVQAGLEKSNVKPNDVERIIYAMGMPTEESENDCTIVQFAKPMSRATLLQEEFGDLPYEKVQFQDTTYYRYADESSSAVDGVRPTDTNNEIPEAAPVVASTVLAKYPDDRQPDANGHADSSGSGKWFYYSSNKQNPAAQDATLAQLKWNPKESRYEGNELRVNRMWPAIGRSLAPAQKSPRYPVLRWESQTAAALTIRGTFRALPDAKSGDGVRVLIFVDGRQEFSMDVKRGDAIGVNFDVSASAKPGSAVDFVVDPKANVGYDSTLLEATIEATGGNTGAGTTLVDSFEEPTVDQEAGTLLGTAIHFPDDQTIVSTSELWLRNMISGPPAQTPLTDKLSQVDLDHDLIGVVALDGIQDQAVGLLGMVAQETGSSQLAGFAAMPKHMKSAVATFDLTGDNLLRLTLEAPNAQSATQLNNGAENLAGLLRGLREVLPQEMPDGTANPLLPLFDDLVGGVTVRQDALNVVVEVKTPNGLAGFVKNDAERVVGSMAPVGIPPRPDVATTGDLDPPVDRSKTETHMPPTTDDTGFRELVINTHDCRIRFPGNPKPEKQSLDTSAGKIEISIFTAEHKGCAYAFSILDYPPSIVSKAGAQTLLNEYRAGIVDEPNGTLLDSKMSNYQGSPSNDFQYVDPDYGAGDIAHCRTVQKGNRMFHLKVVGKAPTADIHAFFQSLVMDDKAGGGPPAGAGTTGQPSAAATIIEPTEDNWEVGAGNAKPSGNELVIDADGGRYWVIGREPLPANFRLQIEGRIEFLQGGQVLQNTQKDILRSMCVRFCTTDQKADILDAKGYHIRHSHTMLLLSKEGKVIARGDVGNGARQVSAIPTANGLKVTIPDREPWPFTMAVTKKDDAISVEANGAKVVDHSDRFYLSSSDKLAIGGYTSRLYLGRVSVTDLGPAKPAPGTPGGAMEIVDRNIEPGRFQPLLLRHPVDRMVLSEDARYLAAAHREADSISVIDVQSLDSVTTIDTPAPRAILWRGDHLFAANEGLGTISMFSESGQWKKVKSITTGDPNPEYMSAPGGRNYRGVIAVRCRGNGRDALPVMIVNVNSGRGGVFNNGRTSAANVDYGGKVMIVQSRAGSPNRYIAGVYNFAAVSQGRATPSMGEQVSSFPLLYQVGATPYWLGGRQVFTGMPMKAVIEAERLLVADRVIDVCYTFKTDQMRCIGLGRTLEDLGSRPIDLPGRVMDVTDIGDLHVAATIGDELHFFLLDSQRTIHTVRLPAFEVPSFFTKADRADTVAKAFEPAREDTEPDEPATGRPIKRTWTDSSGQFQIEAELVEVKEGQVTLKKADGSTVILPIDKLSEADRDFIGHHVAADK